MYSPCDPPNFDHQDWSQFDFSRWHLDGVTLDAAAAAFAGLSEGLFNSDEWRQRFQATLPEIRRQALDFFKEHSRELREQLTGAAQGFDTRIAAAQQRNDGFRKSIEVAAAPPVAQPSPKSYHFAVKVATEKDAGLGLPGLAVRIIDPRDTEMTLVESVTDRDGNAILTVHAESAGEVDKRDTTFQVLGPDGKLLVNFPDAVCIRIGQTETKVIAIPESPATAQHKSAALQLRSEREDRLRTLSGRTETLKRERQSRLEGLNCRLRDNEAIITELERTEGAARASESTPQAAEQDQDQTELSEPESSKKEPRPTGEKRRKKS
jgi:hypothetical protein